MRLAISARFAWNGTKQRQRGSNRRRLGTEAPNFGTKSRNAVAQS